jgi:hypothetical protein
VFIENGSRQAENKSQNQKHEEYTLPGMQNDGEPVTVEAFARIRKYQVCWQGSQNTPGLMKMVQGEDDAVCHPIPFSKDTFHLWQQHTTEYELLTQERVE